MLDPGAVCHFDLGALCYGIVLAAWDRGLGSVINGQGITRSDIVREVADIPEDQVIMTCVAMGYPDDDFPANAVRSDRSAERAISSAMSGSTTDAGLNFFRKSYAARTSERKRLTCPARSLDCDDNCSAAPST